MKTKLRGKKILLHMLALAMVVGLLAACPLAAYADSAEMLAGIIKANYIGGGINTTVSGNTCTVTGSYTEKVGGTTANLTLNISPGVTVVWQAKLNGNNKSTAGLIKTTGANGTFILAPGGSVIQAGAGGYGISAGSNIRIEGGEASTVNGYTITMYDDNLSFTMTGGKIVSQSSTLGNYAVQAAGKGIIATITGGEISSADRTALSLGANAKLVMTGGNISSGGGSYTIQAGASSDLQITGGNINSNRWGAIDFGAGGVVSITGGTVTAKGGSGYDVSAINGLSNSAASNTSISVGGTAVVDNVLGTVLSCSKDVSVSGQAKVTTSGAIAIYVNQPDSTVEISGGLVQSSGTSSATVYNTGGPGVNIRISGGTVRNTADKGYAVQSQSGVVYKSGGVVEATGVDGNRFRMGPPTSIVIERTGFKNEYLLGSSEELYIEGLGASAVWALEGGLPGIRYLRNGNTGFIPTAGVNLADHLHVYVQTPVSPTCTEQGYTECICSICGYSKLVDFVPPLGHNWAKGATTPPTCTTQGFTAYTCTRCGESKTDDYVPPLGHNWVEGAITPPTCTDGGYTVYVCSRCGESKTDDYKAALGHDWDEGKENGGLQPSGQMYISTGWIYTCLRPNCGATYTEPFPWWDLLRNIVISYYKPNLTTVTAGSISGKLEIEATVSDGSTPSYQWYSNTRASASGGTAISGAKSATFTIPTGLTAGTYYYYCVVSAESADSVTSDVSTVIVVKPAISIKTQPTASTTVTAGNISKSLSVAAAITPSGAGLTYQWYSGRSTVASGGTAISGARSATYAIPSGLTAGTYYYYCVVSAAGADSVASNVATVIVVKPAISIKTQPAASTSAVAGSITAKLSVAAAITPSGAAALKYQWYSTTPISGRAGNTAIQGATSATFAVPTDLAEGTYYYYCVVSAAGADSVTSNQATVTVTKPLVITFPRLILH